MNTEKHKDSLPARVQLRNRISECTWDSKRGFSGLQRQRLGSPTTVIYKLESQISEWLLSPRRWKPPNKRDQDAAPVSDKGLEALWKSLEWVCVKRLPKLESDVHGRW